jgi:putative peptide maturation dehydrogenase
MAARGCRGRRGGPWTADGSGDDRRKRFTAGIRAAPRPSPRRTAFDELLAQRITCRNFDASPVPLPDLSDLLHRVFGAQGRQMLAPGMDALKKNSPSGGGLHPIEAYLLVQRVAGLPAGLYHYHCTTHALEPLRNFEADAAAHHAHALVAGQPWFANAPVLVLMAARFERNFWKYRQHPKAWKVVQLDAGHLSQTFALSAAEQGYGAFVTGAINDAVAEDLFSLDGLLEGAVAGITARRWGRGRIRCSALMPRACAGLLRCRGRRSGIGAACPSGLTGRASAGPARDNQFRRARSRAMAVSDRRVRRPGRAVGTRWLR